MIMGDIESAHRGNGDECSTIREKEHETNPNRNRQRLYISSDPKEHFYNLEELFVCCVSLCR